MNLSRSLMSTSKSFFEYVAEQLSHVDGVSFRAMMGEYIIYYRGKVIGGIYDDRVLIKVTASSKELLPDSPLEIPYPGAKPMLMLPDVDDVEFVADIFARVFAEIK